MAKIKPFRAFFYNQQKIKDVSKVVCPPYDIIDSRAQEYYLALSAYNMVHLILGKDIAKQDKYKRARQYFNQWIKKKILIQTENPAIYFYLQQYRIDGEKKIRLGFIALLRLGQRGSCVFPHEHTHIEPKEDRLRLLKNVKANLSPIFVLFRDKNRIIKRTYERYSLKKSPLIEIVDNDKILHKIWKIDDLDLLNLIRTQINDKSIFIADGHHRYEVALMYRNQMRKRLHNRKHLERDYNYIMTYFTDVGSRGLVILPIHRFVKKVRFGLSELKERLNEYFDVDQIKDKVQFFFLMKKSGLTQPTLGLYKEKKFFLLRLKSIKSLDRIINDKPKEYRLLDVVILNYIILKKILRQNPEDKKNVVFHPDIDSLISRTDQEKDSLILFLNPVKPEQMLAVASKGERLPPKSTYFYHKVLSGLVINKFNEDKR